METTITRRPAWPILSHAGVGMVALCVYVLVLLAPNDMTRGDPLGCLLSAQSLLRDGSLDLSAVPEIADPQDYRFAAGPRGVHYNLGFGVCLLATPAVLAANAAGWDMSRPEDDRRLQRLLAAGIVAALFLVSCGIFSLALPLPGAVVVALLATLGSSLASTLGTALWNQGPATLAIAGAAYLVARHELRGGDLRPILLGNLLGIAFFARPSLVLPLVLLLAYAVWRSGRGWPRPVLGLAPWLLVLALVNTWALGTPVSDYYRALGQERIWILHLILQGQLISPGRGLLVFAPFIAPIVVWVLVRGRRQPAALLGLGGVLWLSLHALGIARHAHWWGGTCFGPRLSTDALPAVLLIGLAAAADWKTWRSATARSVAAGGIACLGLAAVWINTAQGLYNPATQAWNRYPSIEAYSHGVFDWRWPQFLATDRRNAERDLALRAWDLEPLPPGEAVDGASGRLLFSGWNAPEMGEDGLSWRWTRGVHSYAAFRIDPGEPAPAALILELGVYGRRTAMVLWNDVVIGSFTFQGQEPRELALPVPREAFAGGSPLGDGLQFLEIRVPDPLPYAQTWRELGVKLHRLRWEPSLDATRADPRRDPLRPGPVRLSS